MSVSPCYNCPHRKVMCHDRCDEYMEFHDALVEAKKSLDNANRAIRFLIEMQEKRARRLRVRK